MQYSGVFENHRARWDKFKAFHTYEDGGFYRFDTGELILIEDHNLQPGKRRLYGNLGVRTWSTNDDWPRAWTDKNFYTKDGEKVTLTQLRDGGQQIILVDETPRVPGTAWHVVGTLAVGSVRNSAERYAWRRRHIPDRFIEVAHVYFGGANHEPFGMPVRLRRHFKVTPDHNQHIQNIISQCQMWFGLNSQEPQVKASVAQQTTASELVGKNFADLDYGRRVYIARGTVHNPPVDTMAQKLFLK